MAKLHFYYSAMNAGKSTTLLQSSYNYNERGMDTLLYTPKLDDRYGEGNITTRIGLQAKAIPVEPGFNIYRSVCDHIAVNPNVKCVLVDEAQFLNKTQIDQLAQVADFMDIPVLAYGIRSDFRGEPFEGSLYLMTWADILIELKTICHCGRKATMNTRVDQNGLVITEGEQVDIGGNERYVSTCRKHFRLQQVSSKTPEKMLETV